MTARNKPCIHGHTSGRSDKTGNCIECQRLASKRNNRKRAEKIAKANQKEALSRGINKDIRKQIEEREMMRSLGLI